MSLPFPLHVSSAPLPLPPDCRRVDRKQSLRKKNAPSREAVPIRQEVVMGTQKKILGLAIAIVVGAFVVSAPKAVQATFPGKNGRISFLEVNASNTAVDIYTINPD